MVHPTFEFSIIHLDAPLNFEQTFQSCPKPLFRSKANHKTSRVWKWIFILMQMKLIITRKWGFLDLENDVTWLSRSSPKNEKILLTNEGGREGERESRWVEEGTRCANQDSVNVNKSTESRLAVTTYSDLYKTFHPSFQISFRYCVCPLDRNRENCDVRLTW